MQATWADPAVTWGAHWRSWAGDEIPLPPAKSVAVLVRQDEISVLLPRGGASVLKQARAVSVITE